MNALDAFQCSLQPALGLLSSEQLAALENLSGLADIRQRIRELFHKANEGELTDTERDEYEGYIRANSLLARLQAEARRRGLKDSGRPPL